ncbi:GvpL/GvpF family gas vesicle protein [Nocardioides panacisoli]|uniref:GvpL/GvpF family gas vesicle protein n=1 Tax=Nocardioides panacisoli TaxID=627624 RepID=A0ABP7IIM8_9ACTN
MTAAPTAHPAGLLVYAVVSADQALPHVSGVGDGPLSSVGHGGVAAVVGPAPAEGSTGPADLRAYHEVVDALAASGPVAPVRFGYVLTDEQQVVTDVLAPRAEELGDLLAALAGRTELKVRARYIEEAVLAEVVRSDPEIRTLRERTRDVPEEVSWSDRVRLGELVAHAVEAKRRDEAADLWDLVAPHVVEMRETPGTGLDHLLAVALLVDDDRVSVLEEALEAYAEAAHERVRVRLTGPLPPYDFVGGA